MGAETLMGSYLGADAQEDAAEMASDTSTQVARMQTKLIREMYDQNRADQLPFLEAGQKAVKQLETADPTGGAQKYLDQLMKLTFPSGVDPTGGMDKYIQELEGLEFEFDANDPVYQWRASENERQVNQFMASRGGYDSRAAANMLLNSGMELQSQETDRQFNQRYLAKYNQLTDLAKLSYQKGQAEYNKATDKYSADVAKSTTGFNAAMTLGGTKYNKLLDLVKVGTGAAGASGSSASNQLTNVLGQMSQDQQNAILQSGASQAQLWNSVGQSGTNTANAALMYYAMM